MKQFLAALIGIAMMVGCGGNSTGEDQGESFGDWELIQVNHHSVGPVSGFSDGALSEILNYHLRTDGLDAGDCDNLITCGGQKLGIAPAAVCFCDGLPWLAKIEVIDGPYVYQSPEPSTYWEDSTQSLWLWQETRTFTVKIIEPWLGTPREGQYTVVDRGGYCPGDMLFNGEGENIRIPGVWEEQSWSCNYNHPTTGSLLARVSGLEAPSGLKEGDEYLFFGADAMDGLTDQGLWDLLERYSVNPDSSTFTGPERLIYKYDGENIDIAFLMEEWGTEKQYSTALITEQDFASLIIQNIVEPFLGEKTELEFDPQEVFHGVLLEAYNDKTE